VILVGGALNDAQSAAPLAAALAPRLTAVSYDSRGRGSSGNTQPYSVEREIEDLGALIAELGGRACLCGHSSGSVLALAAAGAGLGVDKLALFEPPFRLTGGPQLPPDYQQQVTKLTDEGRPGDTVEYFMTSAVGLPAEAVAQLRRSPAWPALEALAITIVYDGLLLLDPALPAERLAAITVPALVLESTGSAPWLRSSAQATARALPNARHLSLTGMFHQIPPETLAPVLIDYFTS
jgi:pimeloyl-ACP methyl ester carboxylesterase